MRILIVEDDVSLRRTIAATVTGAVPVAELDMCGSVSEANEMLQSHPTDIVLLDMMLPGGNGIDVLRVCLKSHYLAKRRSKSRIIASSTKA